MSTQTDRLTKLRNLASHPGTPPAEAAAARARIADIEARNPQAKPRSRDTDEFIRQQRIIRENMDRMARQFEEQRRARRRQPHPADYATLEAYEAAWREWAKYNPVTADTYPHEQSSPRPDPFAGWDYGGDSGGFNQTYGQTASEQAYQRGVKAMNIARSTYSKVSQELHDYGLDVSPGEWEALIRQLLQSR